MNSFPIQARGYVKTWQKSTGVGTETDPIQPIPGNRVGYLDSPPMYQYADTVGDGTGGFTMAVDGSVTPVIFRVAPPVGYRYRIARLIISIRDGVGIAAGGWGSNLGNPLTNGFLVNVVWNSITIPLVRTPIKSHFDLATLAFDIAHHPWGTGDEFVVMRFSFFKAGQYIGLNGDTGDEIQFIVQDDLTYLVDQHISVQGYMETTT